MIDQLRTAMQLASGVMEIPRRRAEKLAKQLVKGVDLPTGQMSKLVDDIVSRSRENAQIVQSLVKSEVRRQVKSLGLATREDVDRLARRVFSMASKEEVERLNERIRNLDARVSKSAGGAGTAPVKSASVGRSSPASTASTARPRKVSPAASSSGSATPRSARTSKPGRVSPKGSPS